MVQMPKGVPVATVAVDGADNAALLAAQILAVSDPLVAEKLRAFKKSMEQEVVKKDQQLQEEVSKL